FAIRLAVRELERLVQDGLPTEAFERTRKYVSGYYALFLQTESRRLGYALDDAYYGMDAGYLERLRSAWAQLDAAAVHAAVRRHLDPARLQIAVVARDAAGFAEALVSDQPSPIEYPAEVAAGVRAEDSAVQEHRLGLERDHLRILPVSRVFH